MLVQGANQISRNARLPEKKYTGICRLATHTRKMMVVFPTAMFPIVRYISRKTRERNSCSL